MNLSRSLAVLRSPLGLALQSSASRPSAGLRIASAKRSLLPAGDQLGVATLFRRSIAVETPFKPEQPKPARKEFAHTIDTKALEAIDVGLQQHHVPRGVADRIALAIVKTLRMPTDIFFKKKYIHRAVMLETVAAVPGMVAAMLRHLKSLRRMKHDGGWIHHLLVEAENERMHLLTWMKITQPKPWERLLVLTVQGVFFNAYFLGYLLSPRTAHRMVGYLEEEAVKSYTAFLEEIDNGHIANTPAPEIAKVYWNLAPNATLRDVVLAVRADEAQHRDVNHHLSDRILAKSEDLRVPLQQ